MDALVEIVLEILAEGAFEATSSKKVPLPVRIALGAALVLVFYGLATLALWCGADSGSLPLMLLGAALFAGFTLIAVLKFREKQRK